VAAFGAKRPVALSAVIRRLQAYLLRWQQCNMVE
jgi:hypothetical protein